MVFNVTTTVPWIPVTSRDCNIHRASYLWTEGAGVRIYSLLLYSPSRGVPCIAWSLLQNRNKISEPQRSTHRITRHQDIDQITSHTDLQKSGPTATKSKTRHVFPRRAYIFESPTVAQSPHHTEQWRLRQQFTRISAIRSLQLLLFPQTAWHTQNYVQSPSSSVSPCILSHMTSYSLFLFVSAFAI